MEVRRDRRELGGARAISRLMDELLAATRLEQAGPAGRGAHGRHAHQYVGNDSRRRRRAREMPLRCVYTDLDGTLLGSGGSLFRDADGAFTLLPARALEACHRAGVEVVLKSGRRKSSVAELARLLGQTAYIYELGAGLVIDGEETLLTGELVPRDGRTVHEQIAMSGALDLLLERYAGRLEEHTGSAAFPSWNAGREASYLLRGAVDANEASALLAESGHPELQLVDNGAAGGDPPARVYHLVPRGVSKARAVAVHMRARGYAAAEVVGVGDSREDAAVAEVVGRFFLVANAFDRDSGIGATVPANVETTEGRNGDGFYEAVVRSLAEGRFG